MGGISRGRELWRIAKAYRQGKRIKVMKPITQSKTTATIAGATGATSGIIFAVLAALRGRVALPWEPEGDTAIVAVLTTVIAPLLSRLVAKYRKGGDTIKPAALGFLLCGFAAAIAGCVATGCAKTHILGPDGTVIEVRWQADKELIVSLATLAADPELYRQGLEIFRELTAYRAELRAAESREDREALEAKIEAAERAIAGLVAAAEAVQKGE